MNDEIAAALGQYFYGGTGPSHAVLSRAFHSAGLNSVDPYDSVTGTPNKQNRVLTVCTAAQRDAEQARRLADALLSALRVSRDLDSGNEDGPFPALRNAFAHAGWSLSDEGRLSPVGTIDLQTGGRAALDQQLNRLRRNIEDPAVVLGTAKDLVEAVAKFVLEEGGMPVPKNADFPHLVTLAFERLRFTTAVVDESVPGATQLRAIFKSAKTVTLSLNELRNLRGTGHGRTLPTGMSSETALFVIREVTHVAELMLSTHDRQMGRSRVS